jgi:predicted DCC family thiol-disulfide oxidoreductase YuxK
MGNSRHGSSDEAGAHLVLYDGVCALCNRVVQFLLRHDRRRVFRFASLQGAAGRSVVERNDGHSDELTSFHVIANYETPEPRRFSRSDAVLFVAGELGWPWKAVRVTGFVPKGIRDRAYGFVARTRYRVFGRLDRCVRPTAEFRNRFID